MNNNSNLTVFIVTTTLLCLAWNANIRAKDDASACVELGALAYDNWTSTDAGGSGMPSGETLKDYVRCKSCHGWDRLGMKGGYVRRTRTAERPNAGYGDTDTTSRDIAPGMGDYYHIRAMRSGMPELAGPMKMVQAVGLTLRSILRRMLQAIPSETSIRTFPRLV